jgi:hypothetical protein
MPDGQTVWLVGLESDGDQFVIIDNVVQVWFYATAEAAERKLLKLKIPPGAKLIIEETGPASQYVKGYSLTKDGEWVPPPRSFIQHGNGVALVVDFTSTEWWQYLTERSDFILFVRPKIQFLPKSDGRMNCLGSTLVAIGEAGIQALRNAERNGRGICFRRDPGIRQRHPLAATTSPNHLQVVAAAE